MYEFHGWCSLRESASDCRAHCLQLAVKRISALVDQFDWANGFCFVQPFNGEHFVHFGGFQNRARKEASDLRSLFELIAREAPGSYGLLYWWDDEDPTPPGEIGWRVRVLAKGRIVERFDPFLSPTIPVIEELTPE